MNMDSVPSTFDAAVDTLEATLELGDRKWIHGAQSASAATAVAHMTIGRWIRNNWGLWDSFNAKDPIPLARDIKERFGGIEHPDDVAGLILSATVHRVRGEAWSSEEHVKGIIEHWALYGCGPDGRPLTT